jgi:hypothetical protein
MVELERKDLKQISSVTDIYNLLDLDIKSVVLVGGAGVELGDADKLKILNLPNPLFVYINHAALSKEIQGYYPEEFKEVIFIRKQENGFHGVYENGDLFFSPKVKENFLGAFLVYLPKKFFLTNEYSIYNISNCLIKEVQRSYQENIHGKVSPTTGYYAQEFLMSYLRFYWSATPFLWTIGMGLDDNVPRFKTHNIDYEQRNQAEMFSKGQLISIGKIIKSHSPVNKRI